MQDLDKLEFYRLQAIKYKNKKGYIYKVLFKFYANKYEDIAYRVLWELEYKLLEKICLK